MNRVATIPLQRTLSGAMQTAQQKLAVTQAQLSTGKKAPDLASLGTEAVRNLSSRTLAAKADAHAGVANRLGTTLALYDANISALDTLGSDLRAEMMETIGTGRGEGLQDAIEAAFSQMRVALNAREGSAALFSGSRSEDPFTPRTLGDTVGLDPAAAFVGDDVRASGRVAEDLDIVYGVSARELGEGLFSAFRTLAEAGQIGDVPTDAQKAALQTALGQIDTGLAQVRSANAANGRRQAQVETLATRADDRALLLRDLISRNEDADLAQVAVDLAQQQTLLQASYSVFRQLSGLSLVEWL
jgi:flagellar hook-associated protein 3 FlgL